MSTVVAKTIDVRQRLQPRLEQPLSRLQRAIQTYVVIEALALAVSIALVWFWATFLLDYGAFWLFGFDYLREGSPGSIALLRLAFGGSLALGLAYVAWRLARRLFATFSPSALALVLERRFPGRLNDRLVTSVELADLDRAEQLGFSRAMLAETVEHAAASVEEVALGSVFNWRRLVVRCVIALALSLTVLAMALLATDAAATWAERDLLMQRSYWPRAILLEIPDLASDAARSVPQGGDYLLKVRALKWVVRDRQNEEGWRALQWNDVSPRGASSPAARAWELDPPLLPAETIGLLPEPWQTMPVDQMETLLKSGDAGIVDVELGKAVVDHARRQIHEARQAGRTAIDSATLAFLPEEWRNLSLFAFEGDGTSSTLPVGEGMESLSRNLDLAAYLRPTVIRELQGLASGTHLGRADGAFCLNGALSPLAPPVATLASLQRVFLANNHPVPALTLLADPAQPPALVNEFHSTARLLRRLEDFQGRYAIETIGARVRTVLQAGLDELQHRAALSHVGRRRGLRQLEVPDQVTVEFEQILTEVEEARGKPRLGRPTVRRQFDGNDFVYEFKKIDRPLRFRVVAGQTRTPWHRIDVKPLPTLRRLTRTQEELGYLHGSNELVTAGPFNVPMEGDQSTFEVPAGTRLRLEGAFTKPIRQLRAMQLDKDQPHPLTAQLEHAADGEEFTLQLKTLVNEDARFRLVFEDLDGIVGERRFHVRLVADREPDFKRATYVLVNRKMITPGAVIPFTGLVQDDHGLTALTYDVSVEGMDRKRIKHVELPFRRFVPLRPAEAMSGGVAFEKRSQATIARLFSAPGSESFAATSVISHLPLAGLLAWTVPPTFGVPNEYAFDYKPRSPVDGVLGIDDEFLDTLWLRTPKEAGQPLADAEPPAMAPYRLVIRLLATDNRVSVNATGDPVAAHQTARSPEAFEFQVVSEEDLLIEVGKREEDLREASERIVEALRDGRRAILKRLQGDFDAKFRSESTYDFRRAANDANDMVRILRDNRVSLDVNVSVPFRDVYRELVLNRCQSAIVERIDRKICRPLELLLVPGQHFSRAEDAVAELARAIESEKSQASPELVQIAIERTDQLIARLDEIVTEMKKLLEFNEALKVLQDIIKAQEAQNKKLEQKLKDAKKSELDD